jgi:hypothetical protein
MRKSHLPLLFGLLLAVVACRKNEAFPPRPVAPTLRLVLNYLHDSLSSADYAALDTSFGYEGIRPGRAVAFWRIGLQGKPLATDFVLVRTDTVAGQVGGLIVHLERDPTGGPAVFNGNISMSTLGRRPVLQSAIVNGYVAAAHPDIMRPVTTFGQNQEDLVPASDGTTLPEVVVVGYIASPGSGLSYTDLMDLENLAAEGGVSAGGGSSGSSGGGAGGGGSASGSGASSSSGSSSAGATTVSVSLTAVYDPLDPPPAAPGSGGPTPLLTPTVQVDEEDMNSLPAISLQSMFNCFNAVKTDANTTYSISICSDVPVNSMPTASADIPGASMGHSFIVMSKSDYGVTVTKSFGFYPAQVSYVTPLASTTSVIKDNGGTEINAEYTESVSQTGFAAAQSSALTLAGKSYNVISNNCTDFGKGVFNAAGGQQITLTPYTIMLPILPPMIVTINSTPQMLFALIYSWKAQGMAGTLIDQTSGTHAPPSTGTCN